MAIPPGTTDSNIRNATRTTGTLPETAVAVVNPDGTNLTVLPFVTVAYDAVTVTYPSTTQEVYAFRTGGISGTIVQTITINYTTASKSFILNVART